VGNATSHKNPIDVVVWRQKTASRKRMSHFFYEKENGGMRNKGETGERDRVKPQPRKKKEREEAHKKKKLARDERRQARQA
jgi:hypothetical protein